MRSILLIAAPRDYEALMEYCSSLSLRLLPMQLGVAVPALESGGHCYLGHMLESELHPYGNPRVKIADVFDPLLLFARPYFSAGFLTDGGIYLNEDEKVVSSLIRPTFEKIRRWTRKNCKKTEAYASYVGPEALRMLESGEAKWRSKTHNWHGNVVVTG